MADKPGDDDPRPWDAPGVTGVTPPGRRLGKPGERRYAKWAAAGVQGVTPPGTLEVGAGPGAEWTVKRAGGHQGQRAAAGRPSSSATPDPGRPTVGFLPNVLADDGDPNNLRAFLDELAGWFRDHAPEGSATLHLSELIGQSHAPYEIIVAFTLLSSLVGTDAELRNRHAWALERGAKAFYNLAMRLDRRVKAPRGLAPQRLDPIFYDLPATAFQIPFAFATDAFLRVLELVRGDTAHDRALVRFARELYVRFVEQRSFGDKPLAEMFPWEQPPWAPEES